MLNSFLRGYYTPSFYKLVVNTTYDLTNLKELEKQPAPFSTFYHEYLHFIQDISTPFGLMNGLIILNQMKYANNYILHGKHSFNIPVPWEDHININLSRVMQLVYMGPVDRTVSGKVAFVKKVESNVFIPAPHNQYLEKIIIGIESDGKPVHEIDFGGLCIIESMAHIAQKHFYPKTSHHDIPYKSAILVAEHLYPDFVKNELYVFALCDACLMTYHPGLNFFEALIGFKQDGIIPKNEEEVYELVYSRIKGNERNLLDIYHEINESAKKEFTHYFTTKLYENERVWITTILERAYKLRTENPTFLLDLLKQDKAKSDLFIELILELGSPLIENLTGETHMFIPRGFENVKVQIDVFSSINEIFQLFDSGRKSCGLKGYCKNSEEDITDWRCSEAPWQRSSDIKLCGYGVLWKTWGLSDFKPITN